MGPLCEVVICMCACASCKWSLTCTSCDGVRHYWCACIRITAYITMVYTILYQSLTWYQTDHSECVSSFCSAMTPHSQLQDRHTITVLLQILSVEGHILPVVGDSVSIPGYTTRRHTTAGLGYTTTSLVLVH